MGQRFQDGLTPVCRHVNVPIVQRSDAGRFVVLPRRWIVERTIAWPKTVAAAWHSDKTRAHSPLREWGSSN